MNERARNLKEILKSIIANEEESKEFEKLKTISEIYEKCIAKGYKGGMEEFTSDLMTLELLPKELIEMIEEELNGVSGGKLDAKKGIASILSGLTVMSAGVININAAPVSKEASKKVSVSSKKNSLLNKSFLNKVDKKAAGIAAGVGTGLLAVGTIGYYMVRSLRGEMVHPTNSHPHLTYNSRHNSEIEGTIEEIIPADFNGVQDSWESLKSSLNDVLENDDILKELIFKSPVIDTIPISCTVYYNIQGSPENVFSYLQDDKDKEFYTFDTKYLRAVSNSIGVLENLSEFASELQNYIGRGFGEERKIINFNNCKKRNLMGEIYCIQSFISVIINNATKTQIDGDKVNKLKEINAWLSDFEGRLLDKVNLMNWDLEGSK